jgi:glycosyltransferase involved in cell wall biosynthesis
MHPVLMDSQLSCVCFFSHSAELAGAERSLLELTTELVADHGLRCDVVLPSDGPLVALLAAAGVATHIVPSSWWCTVPPAAAPETSAHLTASLESTLLATCNELAAINPDVVCTNTLVAPWGAVAARLLGKPHVWYVREFGRLDHELAFAPPFADVLRIIDESSARIIVNSDAVGRELFGGICPDKCETVYNYVPTPKVSAVDSPRHFNKPGAFHLLLLGSIAPGKGQKEAVLAVDELRRSGVDVELLLAGGSGPAHRAEIEHLIEKHGLSDNVRLAAFLRDPYPAIFEADALLSCSRHEAFGRTLLEAMLLGKPVVAARAGGIPEIVTDGQTGLLYESGDHAGLAKAIASLINDPQRTAQLASQGRSWATGHFTKERYGGRVRDILQQTVTAWRRQPRPFDDFWKPQALHAIRAWHRRWQAEVSGLQTERTALQTECSKLQTDCSKLQTTVSAQATTLQERLTTIREREEALAKEALEVNRLRAIVAATQEALAAAQNSATSAALRVAQLEPALAAAQSLSERLHHELQALQGSRAWKTVLLYYAVRDRLLPQGSRRRAVVKAAGRLAISLWQGRRKVAPRRR